MRDRRENEGVPGPLRGGFRRWLRVAVFSLFSLEGAFCGP